MKIVLGEVEVLGVSQGVCRGEGKVVKVIALR